MLLEADQTHFFYQNLRGLGRDLGNVIKVQDDGR